MKCLDYLFAILACLLVLMVSLGAAVIIKYRVKIWRWWRKHAVSKFLFNILFPFAIPLVLTLILEWDDLVKKWIKPDALWEDKIKGIAVLLMFFIAFLNSIFQFVVWIKDIKEADVRWENEAIMHAFENMFEIHQNKNTFFRSAYHGGLTNGILTDSDVPYDVFDQIRKITWGYCHTISRITNISIQDLSAAFVYHYAYESANEGDRKWRWITGKGSKFSMPLTDFIEESDSTFHYMIHNSVSTVFYNDKEEAMKDKKYQFSYRDHSHNFIGSFVAAKVAFSGNDGKICEGIIMVTSYGTRFLDNDKVHTEDELAHLILDDIFP